MKKKENIFISWFYLYYGTAFLKHVLASFSINKPNLQLDKLEMNNISQEEMEIVFSEGNDYKIVFDKIYILYTDNTTYKKVTEKSHSFRKQALVDTDEEIKKTNTVKEWEEILSREKSIQEEYEFIEKEFPEKKDLLYSQYWRNIQHYTPEEQIWWLKEKSNLPKEYIERLEFINVTKKYNFKNLKDYDELAKITYKNINEINNQHHNSKFYVNVSLSTTETTVVWFSLSQGGLLPSNSVLFEHYDVKNQPENKRFKRFYIKSVHSNILDRINSGVHSLYDNKPLSNKRKIANDLFKVYKKQGFAITFLGERGIGKSDIIKTNISSGIKDKSINSVDCSIYENDDFVAEKEIFGYTKDAYRGATRSGESLFKKSEGGTLIFDEISKLSFYIQSRLMKSLSTDEKNRFSIVPMGGTKSRKIKCNVYFTTSENVESLKIKLLPDFFDRIMQLTIELPPLRDTLEEIPFAFKNVWEKMLFEEQYPYEKNISNEVIDWVKGLPLYGNYRDLQRIAIWHKTYLEFSEELKKELAMASPHDYLKNQYDKYMVNKNENEKRYFDNMKSPNEIITDFKYDLATWLTQTHGTAKASVKYIVEELHGKISEKTISNWKNKK